jgi:site-specific recombinase XerD
MEKIPYNNCMSEKGREAVNALIAMNNNEPETMNAIAAELSAFTGIDDPSTWTADALLQALRKAKENRRADAVNRKINIAGIDFQKELSNFLSDRHSPHTARAYASAVMRLEKFASSENINPLEMDTRLADMFIRHLRDEGRSAASVRRDIAAASAFFTFLERNYSVIKNPIKGTGIRPRRENKKEAVIPTAAEYQIIISELPSTERAIVIVMATRGLRIGTLPTLELKTDGKYHGRSKGKTLTENNTAGITLPPEALKAIRTAELDTKKPFAWRTRQGTANNANALERRINNHIRKLYQAKKITAAFSAHDFRHFFAVEQYKKKKDIYRLSMLLNHSNIAITQTYLRGLNVKL